MIDALYQIAVQSVGPDHSGESHSLGKLGKMYQTDGHYAKAERFYERALAIMKEVQGPGYTDVASVLKNLGEPYYTQGNYVNARPIYRCSLQILNRAFTPDS